MPDPRIIEISIVGCPRIDGENRIRCKRAENSGKASAQFRFGYLSTPRGFCHSLFPRSPGKPPYYKVRYCVAIGLPEAFQRLIGEQLLDLDFVLEPSASHTS